MYIFLHNNFINIQQVLIPTLWFHINPRHTIIFITVLFEKGYGILKKLFKYFLSPLYIVLSTLYFFLVKQSLNWRFLTIVDI